MKTNPVLVKDWREVLGQVVVKKYEAPKAVTTPPATRTLPSSKKLWADYCLLVTPLKGEAK